MSQSQSRWTIKTEEGGTKDHPLGLKYGTASCRGHRGSMEDSECCKIGLPGIPNSAFFGVFDGHAGSETAKYASQVLVTQFLQHMRQVETPSGGRFGDRKVSVRSAQMRARPIVVSSWPPSVDDDTNISIADALPEAFCSTDKLIGRQYHMLKNNPNRRGRTPDAGCTACCVVLTQDHHVFANLGDSRALLCSAGKVAFATADHKPVDPVERDRIYEAGGFVLRGRVCAALAVARALGDHQFKDPSLPQEQQMVTPCPDITFIDRNSSDDEFLVIACDGVYDVMSNVQVMQHVRHNLFKGMSTPDAAAALVDSALKRGSTDNCSAIVVDLIKSRSARTQSIASQRASNQVAMMSGGGSGGGGGGGSNNNMFPPINQQRNNPFTQGYSANNATAAAPPPPPDKSFDLSQTTSSSSRKGSNHKSSYA